jgi:cytoskeletal protein CcmA (bactofilin family)
MLKQIKLKEHNTIQRNVIARTTVIEGEINSDGDFRIDGVIEGILRVKGKVIIGKDGKVNGILECANADVEGEVYGSVKVTNMLTLKASAAITGEVLVGKLTVEPGASFNASCSMEGMVKHLKNNGGKEKDQETTS